MLVSPAGVLADICDYFGFRIRGITSIHFIPAIESWRGRCLRASGKKTLGRTSARRSSWPAWTEAQLALSFLWSCEFPYRHNTGDLENTEINIYNSHTYTSVHINIKQTQEKFYWLDTGPVVGPDLQKAAGCHTQPDASSITQENVQYHLIPPALRKVWQKVHEKELWKNKKKKQQLMHLGLFKSWR